MKKRFISMLLIICLVVTMLPDNLITKSAGFAGLGTRGSILYGDADGSGHVDLEDLLLVERYINGEEIFINLKNADVNADGVVDEIDSNLIREYLVGNISSLTPVLHTITFDTDGGDEIPPIKAGEGYPYRGLIENPSKDGAFFIGWALEDGETYYQNDYVIVDDLLVYALYEEYAIMQTLSISSFSLSNQPPTVGFDIIGDFESSASVKANLTLVPKDGSDPVLIEVLDNGLCYTVFAPDGFKPGATYELTLGDGLTFVDKEDAIRTCYFMIAKDEIDNLKYNSKLIFIKDTEEMRYTVGSNIYEVLIATLLSNSEGTDPITGTFPMSGGSLVVGDVVCIYESVHPKDRDYTQDAYTDDALAYVRITSVSGIIYGFTGLDEDDLKDVLFLADTIVYKVDELPSLDGIVQKLDFDTYAHTLLGKTSMPEFNIDDILLFYTGDFELVISSNYADVIYGQITSVHGNNVYYKIVSKEYIEDFTGMYVYQQVDGKSIIDELTQEQQDALLGGLKQQALSSGFVDQAGEHMIRSALLTGSVQSRMLANGVTEGDIEVFFNGPSAMLSGSSSGKTQFVVEGVSVSPTFIYGKRFKGGIGLKLEVCLTLSIDTMVTPTTKSSLKIELTAAFEEEIAVAFAVDIDDKWSGIKLEEIDVTVSVDIQNYTSISVGAKIYTVGEEVKGKWDALSDNFTGKNASPVVRDIVRQVDKLGSKLDVLMKTGEPDEGGIMDKIMALKSQLPTVEVDGVEYSIDQLEAALKSENVSSAFSEVFSAKTEVEAKVGLEQLMDKYTQMINQESQWVEVFNKQLFEKEFHIKVIAIKISLNFIVRAHVNISLGADMEYQVGKRYTFWVHVFDMEAGSSEIDLIDERFAFQFYVMGTLGLKVGIKAEIAVGIISTKIASVGANVEFGPYVKIYGYFVYIYEKLRPANTEYWESKEEMLGALYIDFGLYITVNFKAQAFDDKFVYEPTLYDGEFPLLTVGARQNVYDFAYHPSDKDILYIDDEDANSSNGITMKMPQAFRDMRTIDLVTGIKSEKNYPVGNYLVTFNDSRFSINDKGVISVDVPATGVRYIKAEMRIVWKVDKLAFSKYDTDITVPIIWTNMTTLERSEKFSVSVAVGNVEEGYQTVWSDRYSRLDVFDLPTEEVILDKILYSLYEDNGENLRYGEVIGYQGQTTDLSITEDKVYLFEISPKTYTLTVNGVHNTDGSITNGYTINTQYGKTFNFSDLKLTGKNSNTTQEYTSFNNLTDGDGHTFDMGSVVNLEFLVKDGTNVELSANYMDNSKTATFTFIGIPNIDPLSIKFKSRGIPNFEGLTDYVRQKGGEGAIIIDISPEIAKTENSINYIVTCQLAEPALIYYVIYNTKGGEPIAPHEYMEGAKLFPIEPTRDGYTFDQWINGINYQPFSFDGQYMPRHNVNIFAEWIAKEYTIVFDPNYEGAATTTKTVVFGERIWGFPFTPSYPGYVFVGWFDEAGNRIQEGDYYETARDQVITAHWNNKLEFDNAWILCNPNQTYDYDNQARPIIFNMAAGYGSYKDSITVQYKKQGTDRWTKTVPINAGAYDVKFTRAGDGLYNPMPEKVISGALIINRIPILPGGGNLDKPTVYGRAGSITIGRPAGILGDGKITYILANYDDPEYFEGQIYTSSTGFFTNLPPGTYYASVSVAQGTNYLKANSKSQSFELEGYIDGPYQAKYRIMTTDGTDADITGGLYLRSPAGLKTKSHDTLMDKPGYNDFEAGDDDEYELGGGLVPWAITGGWIYKAYTATAAPAWSFTSELKIYGQLYGADLKWSGTVKNFISGNDVGHNVLLEKYDENLLRRDISLKNALPVPSSINLASTDNFSYSYDCIISDQFLDNYNPLDYVGSPTLTVTSGIPAYDRFIIYTGLMSFEIDTQGLANHIIQFGGEVPRYKITLEFPRNTVNKINSVDRNKVEAYILSTNVPSQSPIYQSGSSGSSQPALMMIAPMSLMLRGGASAMNMVIDLNDLILNSGKDFNLPLVISGDTPIWGILAGISFDTSLLELTGITIGNLFEEEQFTLQNDLTTGSFKLLATRTELDTILADGTLVTLSFRVKDGATDGETAIGIELLEAVNTTSSVLSNKGPDMTVTVDSTAPTLLGDVDGKTFCQATDFTVVDANIDFVKVNNEIITLVDDKFTLEPAVDAYTIDLVDKAGNTNTVTVTINNDHTWLAGDIIKEATYFEDGQQEYTCQVCGHTKIVTIPKLSDLIAPTGEITVGTNKWNSFLNTITFGLFFKETQSVQVTASDDESGLDKTHYYLSSTALTEAEALDITEWTAFSGSFNINPNNKYVVYVKITDKVGNITIINTDGLVLDNVLPQIGGATDGATYCQAVTLTVSDDNLDTVTLNGEVVTLTEGKLTLSPAQGSQIVIATDKAGNSTTLTITVNDGHTWLAGDIIKEATYFEDGQQEYTCQVCGATKLVTIPKLIDLVAPTGEITVGTNKWNSFLNTITFGLFFKETQSVQVTASDDESGIDKTYYYLSNIALTAADAEGITDWVEFTNSFNIDPNNKYVVYVKITDKVGNTTIINTNGLVLDDLVPLISGVTDGGVYCEAVTITVTDDNLDTVTLNGESATLTEGKLTLSPAQGAQTIVATDKAGNSTTLTITVNDGHTWIAGDIIKEATYFEDGQQEYTCQYCGETKLVTIPKLIDITAPIGEITVGTSKWNSFLNTITFGLFFKETQSVQVTASDGESGLDKIYYYLSNAGLTEAEALDITDWTAFSGSFNINPNNKYVVYVKITDKVGNITIISTDGIVLDNVLPQIGGVTDGGIYSEAVTITVTDDNLDTVTLNGEPANLTEGKLTVNPAIGAQTIVATDKAGNSTTVTITVNDGHTWIAGDIIKEATYFEDGQQEYICQHCGETKLVTIPKLVDLVAPTGEITVGTSKWNSFLNTITFGLFFKETQSVQVTASDDESGLDKTYYYLSTTALTEAQAESVTDWVEFTNSFNIDPNNKYVVYVKITDKVGNTTIINTNGLVLDDLVPVISGVTDGGVYCEAVTITVTDDNLDTVTLNGEPVTLTEGKLTASPAIGAQTIVATDKAGNSTTLTITVNDGHTWIAGDIIKEATYFEDGQQEYTCQHCGETKLVTIPKLTDIIAPTGEITVGTNKWNSFLNTITFGLFFKETQSVEVTASDGESGLDKTYYYLSNSGLTEAEALDITDWTTFSGSFNINANNKYVVYVKITDKVGNIAIISTDGIVLDNVLPQIGGVTDGGVYCEAVTITVTDDNLDTVTLNGEPATLTEGKLTLSPAQGDQTVIATDKAGNSTTLTITVNDGHTWIAGDIIKEATYFEDGQQEYICQHCGETKLVTIPKLVDISAPTGEITVGTNKWNNFLNTITFGLFFKETQSVEVTASDGESGLDKTYYYLSNSGLTEAEALDITEWTTFSGSFNINPNNKYVVYVKITDKVGNVTIISTDGLVLDSVVPKISGVTDGGVYCEAVTITVTDDNLDTVTLNGEPATLTEGKLTLSPAQGDQTVIATDKAGNSTTLTITVNDGHTWIAGDIIKEATYFEDGQQEYTCQHCGETKLVTIPKLTDIIAPTGEITVGTNKWNSFLNTITFGLFFKETQSVQVTASDGESGFDKTYYYLSNSGLTEAEALDITEWTAFSGSFNINPNNKYVVYVKITDKVGNITIISTDGLVLDSVVPKISGVTDGGVYCEAVTITVTDDNLDKVTINGQVKSLVGGKLMLSPAAGTQTIVASDKAGNSTTLTITVNDGHSWDKGVITLEATVEQEGIRTYTCQVCGATRTEAIAKLAPDIIGGQGGSYKLGVGGTLIFRSNAAFGDFLHVTVDGDILDPSNYNLSGGSIVVELKEEYLESLSAGTHTVGIVSEGGTAYTQFTIEAKSQEGEPPKTGDNSNLAMWVSLFFISAGSLVVITIRSRKRRLVK